MAIQSFNKTGTKATTAIKLPTNIFNEEIKSHDLLHQAFVTHHASLRSQSAHAMTRAEIRGGGRKPWVQKGTGRARHGSIRSPLWRGGGVTFGPNAERNYSKRLPLAAKRKAIRQALTLSAQDGSLSVIDDFDLKDAKTKSALSLVQKLALPAPLLIVVDKKSEGLDRATRNLADVSVVTARYLSVYRLANAAHVLLTKPAINELENWLAQKKQEKTDD